MSDITLTLPTANVHVITPEAATATRREFLTPIPGLPSEALLVLDNTSLDKIKRCPKAGENYLILGRESPARNAALVYGGAIHEGLELFHKWLYFKDYGSNADEAFGPTIQDRAVTQFWTDNPAPPDSFRTLNNALEVLKQYRIRSNILLHPDYEMEILSDSLGPIIERAFELPLCVLEGEWKWKGQTFTRIHVAWSGRIDLIARINQRVRVVDNKTSSRNDSEFLAGFMLSSQTVGYNWAGRTIWPELWPEPNSLGFCLNGIYCNSKTAASATLAGRSLSERGPKSGEPALTFGRSYFNYSEERLDRWERDTIATIEDFLHCMSRDHFPLNDQSCINKYGRCPYHDCCVIDDERVGKALLMSDSYKSVTWNPTTGR